MLKKRLLLSLAFAGALLSGGLAKATAIPATPEPGAVRIALEPWLGYGQWAVADKKGFFAKEGLKDVTLVNFNEDKDLNAAMAGGKVDAACVSTNTAMAMVAAGLPVKAVLLMDFSNTADAILAPASITSIEQLKGKQVAYEEGSTSDVLLHYALAQAHMSMADITKVPMPADSAGGAMLAGRVPVAVTYEPYISAALAAGKGYHRLFTAGVDPGLISDVLIVSDNMIKNHPGQVLALLRSWQDALSYYQANTADGRAIIAASVGSDLASLNTAFDGVTYYSVPAARAAFNGNFKTKTFNDVLKAAQQAGIVTGTVTPAQVLDADFLNAVQ
ncbi:MAG: ABC transporter substrate-binding protein [Acidocella sp.]|nr:ABC transporter substrate-binding protein [Acidocella sp.]